MITPEQAADAVANKKTLVRTIAYSTSESKLEDIHPIEVKFLNEWYVVSRDNYEYAMSELYLTRQDAMLADADRLQEVGNNCITIAHNLRAKVKKS